LRCVEYAGPIGRGDGKNGAAASNAFGEIKLRAPLRS